MESSVAMYDLLVEQPLIATSFFFDIQRWDLRNASTSEKKFMAHMGFVTSLDFHPSGRFLASGGRDKTIKVKLLKEAFCIVRWSTRLES